MMRCRFILAKLMYASTSRHAMEVVLQKDDSVQPVPFVLGGGTVGCDDADEASCTRPNICWRSGKAGKMMRMVMSQESAYHVVA